MTGRTVPEWIGKTPDSKAPKSCWNRVHDRQKGSCALCRVLFGGISPHLDHTTPLWMGGENREWNLQLLCLPCHATKTKGEAKIRAKANRQKSRFTGAKQPKGEIQSRGFDKTEKRPKIDKSQLPPLGPPGLAERYRRV